MNQHVEELAIDYGKTLMQKITGAACNPTQPYDTWQPWAKFLWLDKDVEPLAVQSIWSMVTIGKHAPDPQYIPIWALSTKDRDGRWVLNPHEDGDDIIIAARALGADFVEHGGATETNFNRFYYLMQKYASTLPCTYGEEGVSLFRQWSMVAALMAITEGEAIKELPELALIALDLPGIQTMVYTITARGAGKGVRGRSAFVQLLIASVVDRLLDELDLCLANVIINAGGNALILCKWDDRTAQKLKEVEHSVNKILFDGDNHRLPFAGFKGDLFLALAHVKLPQSALIYPVEMEWDTDLQKHVSQWQYYEKQLKMLALDTAKRQPFHTMISIDTDFAQLFEPDVAISDRFCVVCRRPEDMKGEFEEDDELPEIGPGQPGAICPECQGFEELAQRLAQPAVYLNRYRRKPTQLNKRGEEVGVSAWQEALHAVRSKKSDKEGDEGYWYSLDDSSAADGVTLALNLDDFPKQNVDGFYLLATTTPTKWDTTKKKYVIRDNSELADDNRSSLKRLGVLKADVDNLASLLVSSLDKRSVAQTAMLSDSLSLFFGSWLDKICDNTEIVPDVQTKDKVYVLYAGGDDLLIIGSWDVIPYLAKRIADDFRLFTGKNPGVHLSAGIVLVEGKEPLYAAVESADRELDKAKGKGELDPKKNAITFLGKTYEWNDFDKIVKWQERLVDLRQKGVPSSFIGALLTIYEQYRRDRGEISGIKARGKEGVYQDQTLFLGPWLWKLIYSLTRITQGKEHDGKIDEIQKYLLEAGGIKRMSVSARWAQFLTREGSQNDKQHSERRSKEGDR